MYSLLKLSIVDVDDILIIIFDATLPDQASSELIKYGNRKLNSLPIIKQYISKIPYGPIGLEEQVLVLV